MKATKPTKRADDFAAPVGRALRRAGKTARKTAKAHGTAVFVWRNGNVVAERP